MSAEASLVDSALRLWKSNVERAGQFFSSLTEEQLSQEIAPGRNRLLYLWGHLAAVNDAMLPLLGFGDRLHPELDAMFLNNPDRAVKTVSATELKRIWEEGTRKLDAAFAALTAEQWLQRHTAVSEADFAREPHRNRFAILLSRAGHIAYHLGQTALAN